MPQLALLGPEPPWLPAVLGALGKHRFLTVRQVGATLPNAPVAELEALLNALVASKYLVRLHPFDGVGGKATPPVFALRRLGAALLARHTGKPAPAVPHPRKSLPTLLHEGLVAEVGIVFEQLDQRGALSLQRFETSREHIATAAFLPGRGELVRVPLVADAFTVVRDGDKLHGFLIECDRGTISTPRMRQKMEGYHAWWALGGPLQRFGVRGLRVLFIAPNEKRSDRLRETAMEATDGRGCGLFWFATEADVTVDDPERLLAPIWTPARQGAPTRQPLFPAIQAEASSLVPYESVPPL